MPSEIPEEARKMMEEQLRNRRGISEGIEERGMPTPKSDTIKTPSTPPLDQKQMLEERKGF
jgi:hypothetical protein